MKENGALRIIDWPAIKLEYKISDISYKALAEKHHVNLKHLERKASREGWVAEKKAFQAGHVREPGRDVPMSLVSERSLLIEEYSERLLSEVMRQHMLVVEKADELLNYGEPFSPRDMKLVADLMGKILDNRKKILAAAKELKQTDDQKLIIEWVNNEWDEPVYEEDADGVPRP